MSLFNVNDSQSIPCGGHAPPIDRKYLPVGHRGTPTDPSTQPSHNEQEQ